jgi:hypothetical protein
VQDQDFAITSLLLQDQQRLIAAGKVQRWDVVKWTTAVNLALATASVGIGTGGGLFFLFAVLVAAAGGALVYHYNKRMTGARRGSDQVTAHFREAGIDLSKIIPVEEARGIVLQQCTMLRSCTFSVTLLGALYCQHSWHG